MEDRPAHRRHPISGWVLIVLGALFLADRLVPGFSAWVGPAGLGLGGILLLLLYAGRRGRSALILPAGALLTLGTVGALRIVTDLSGGSVLFAGVALTFAAYGLAPPLETHRGWAFWLAGMCLVLALVTGGVAWAWPLALIGMGAYLLLRRRTSSTAQDRPQTPRGLT
jgi:hypothetical protein